ncbi:MAG: hypothetical protein OEV44_09235, partial [Spirochaetota bacterium]|nr:hypothetical protein [Spirochaetota bacterium]
ALTESEKIARQVQLLWGVFPLMLPASFNKNKDWKSLCQSLIDKGLANSTDLMIVTETTNSESIDKMNSLKVVNYSDSFL